MVTESPVGRQCRKCRHVRTRTDAGPAWSCPACGGVYAKTHAIAAEQEEAARDAARNPVWGTPAIGGLPPAPPPLPRALAEERRRTARAQLAYVLLLPPFGLTAIGTAVVARETLADTPSGWLADHARWQLRTFWTIVVVGLVLAVLAGLLIGGARLSARMAGDVSDSSGAGWLFVPALALWGWTLYRTGVGWLLLQRGDRPPG